MAVLILAAARTALGSFGGSFKHLTSVDLGAVVLKAALDRSGVGPGPVAEVVLGNVLQAGSGPNVARQAALRAGLPPGVPALTLNQAGGSGLRAIALAAQGLAAGEGDFALAGGTESMSNSPYLLPGARWGARIGATQLLDSVILDGLGEGDGPSGAAVGLGRDAQDSIAAESRRRATAASLAGAFLREIVPVTLAGRQGDRIFAADECLDAGLAPAFAAEGMSAGGHAADGAAAVLLGAEAAGTGLEPIARILGFAQAGGEPAALGTGPAAAIRRLLLRTGLSFQQVDRWELDEASAAHGLGLRAELPEIDPERVNVRGSALALGRPLGASGARLLVTLLHILQDQDLRIGVAALDAGGGLGVAMVVERL